MKLNIGVKQDIKKLGYIGKNSVDRDAWFTPSKYIESVREVLGTIDLDPFSSKEANVIVNAKRYLTIEDDAFKTLWGDKINVFMNPPYGRGICGDACSEFLKWWKASTVSNAIVLTNNATDTKWFQEMSENSNAICFTNHRIAFYNADGKNVSGNTRGQAFFFFGEAIQKFKNEFSKFGIVVEKL